MVIEKTAEQALTQLINQKETQIGVGEYLISIRIFDSKMTFSTPVYLGEQFIPMSVRSCLFTNFRNKPFKLP